MSVRIDKLIDLFFGELPYSEEAVTAREKVRAALREEMRDRSFESLAENYCSLEKLAAMVGYSSEDVFRWRGGGEILDLKSTKKSLRKKRWMAYLIALLFVTAFAGILRTVYYAIYFGWRFFPTLGGTLLCAAGAFLLLGFFHKKERRTRAAKCDAESYFYLRDRSDKYAKRFLNAIAFFFAALTIFEIYELSFYFFGNSKSAELLESVFANILLVSVPLYLLIKNLICVKMLARWISLPDWHSYRTHILGLSIFCALYWSLTTVLLLLLRAKTSRFDNILLIAASLFFLLIFLYNYTLRKRVTQHNFVINRRRIVAVMILVLLAMGFPVMRRDTWYTQTYINAVPFVSHASHPISYDEMRGIFTMTTSGEDFKILHLTDIHLGGSLFSYRKDLSALQACYAEIEYSHPDLVIVTGDLCFPLGVMSMSFNNFAPVHQFAAFMRNVGIPWAFTYGNHDTENLASMGKEELDGVYKSLSYQTSGTLLYPYVQPDIMGRNNQLIEIRNPDGTLNTALFLIDSNAYTGEGINAYDYIHDDQVEWYASEVVRLQEKEGGRISSLAFFHIPLQEYRTAYDLYLAGSDEVEYHFGANHEKMMKLICCSKYPSSFFDKMVELGSTTGTFCGHDHYNNISLTYKGVRLTYGMSIDYLAMPGIWRDTEQRGAELITLHPDSTWDVVQIPLTSIRG